MSASKARKIVELYREIERRDQEIALLRANLDLQQRSYEREIELEVAAERERCAKLCEDMAGFPDSEAMMSDRQWAAHVCAAAIRGA